MIINPSILQQNGITREEAFKGYMSFMIASSMLYVSPESFEKNLNTLLTANNLPKFSTGGLDIANSLPKVIPPYYNPPIKQTNNPLIDPTLSGFNPEKPANASRSHPSNSTNNNLPQKPSTPSQEIFDPYRHALKTENVVKSTTKIADTKNADNELDLEKSNASANISAEKNIKPSSLNMKLRSRKCNIYVKNSATTNLGKGFSLTQGIAKKHVVLEHNCTNEIECIQVLHKKIQNGDHTGLMVQHLSENKFNDKFQILMGVDN